MPNQQALPTGIFLGIYCSSSVFVDQAQKLSTQLQKPLLKTSPTIMPSGDFVMHVSEQGVALQETGKQAPGPIVVDFAQGSSAHRRQFGGGKGQMIAKAIGLKGTFRPHVVDVTAGLGQDGFVLATLGCQMTLVERSPIIYQLLHDGLERTQIVADESLQSIVARISLSHCDSVDYLNRLELPVDVIYLDPMFPERSSKAAVNKSMKAFHSIVGEDNDAGKLLLTALNKATYRVVVKRPRKAPSLDKQHPELPLPKPNLVFEGKSTRFDVYPLKKMP
ncbi:MAG: 16S rRNA (guanine1516-N2)-methyltransferase [Kiritimatiellia bacterium]